MLAAASHFAIVVAIATSLGASQQTAQRPITRADFSGAWTLVPLTDSPDDGRGAALGQKVTIRRNASTLTFVMKSGMGSSTITRAYRLNGETKQTVKTGEKETRSQTATLKWTDRTLVIRTKWPLNERTTTHVLNTPNEMSVSTVHYLLHERGGQLTMDPIAPSGRLYRRDSK